MKLIFDLTKTQPIGNFKFHGGGKYGEVVFKALVKCSTGIIGYYNSAIWLNPEIIEICKENNVLLIDAAERSIRDVVTEYKGVVYSPIVESNMQIFGDDITYITTIHGLRMLEFPNDKYTGYYKSKYFGLAYDLYYKYKSEKIFASTLKKYREILKKKNFHAVTVSEHSKGSLLSFIPYLKHQDIKVFYSPSTVSEVPEMVEPYNLVDDRYYLIVSADRWIKNALRAIKVLDDIFTERPEFKGKVVITGAKDDEIFKGHIKNISRFKFLDYVDGKTLLALYKGAYLFVYPSLNEGFGYPPLEAMAQGTPVIASAISSIPEVCGDSVLYFNPLIESEIKMRILQMEDAQVRDEYIKKQKHRFKEVKDRQDEDLKKLTEYILSFTDHSG